MTDMNTLDEMIRITDEVSEAIKYVDFDNPDINQNPEYWVTVKMAEILENDFNYSVEMAEEIASSIPYDIKFSKKLRQTEVDKIEKIVYNFAKAIYNADIAIQGSNWTNKSSVFYNTVNTMTFRIHY